VSLPKLDWISRKSGLIKKVKEGEAIKEIIKTLDIRTPSETIEVRYLSGGNQQKVVLAKWLAISPPKLIIFDEPTRGIDVGAKREIYNLMRKLTKEGIGILMVSSELPEILGMCDRILVMARGQIMGELSRKEANEEKILYLSTIGNRTTILKS